MTFSITPGWRTVACGLTGLAVGYGIHWQHVRTETPAAPRAIIPLLEDRQSRAVPTPRFDAQAATEELTKMDAAGQAQKIRRLFDLDPRGTLTFLDQLPDRKLALALGSALLQQFPANAFPMLRDWAARPDETGQYPLLVALLPYWVRVAPEEAMAFAGTFTDSPEKRAFVRQLLSALQPEDRLALLARLPVEAQQALLPGQAASFRGSNPESAFAFITGLPPSKARTEALTNLLANWVGPENNYTSDPKGAVATVAQLTDPKLRDFGFRAVGAAWSKVNLAGACDWVAGLPAGATRDSALTGMITCLASENADAMYVFGAGIWDPLARWRALEIAGGEWVQKNPETAAGYIKGSRLYSEEKQYLQSFLEPGP